MHPTSPLLGLRDCLARSHRIGTYPTVICKERYGVIIVGAESIGHLGRVSSGALL